MRLRSIANLLMLAGVTLLFAACGGGGGGGGSTATPVDPNAAATVTVTASKAQALAGDLVTITANVTKNAGGPIADGTVVTFSKTSGNLSSATATTTSGVATVTLSHAALTVVQSDTSTVTAAAGAASGSTAVKFITQPDGANVYLTITPAQTNLVGFQFEILRTGGNANFNLNNAFAMNQLIGQVFAEDPITHALPSAEVNNIASTGTVQTSLLGISTTNLPILRYHYSIISGLPTFTLVANDTTPPRPVNGVIAFDTLGTTLGLTTSNLTLTVEYLLGGTVL